MASSSNSSLSSALHGGNSGAGDPPAIPTRSSSSLPQERVDVHSSPAHSGHVLRFLAFGASLHGNAECRESAKTLTKRRHKGETTDACLSLEAVAYPDRHSSRCLSSVCHFAQDNTGFYGKCTSSCSSCCTSTSPWDSQASCLCLNPSRDEAAGSVSLQKRVEAPLQCLSASLAEVHRRGDRSYVSIFENEGHTRESLLQMGAFCDAHNNSYSLDTSRCRPRHQCHGPSLGVSCSESITHINQAAERAVDPSSGAKDTTHEIESSHSKVGDPLDSIFDAEAGQTIQGNKTRLRVESRTFSGKSPKTAEPPESHESAMRRDRNSEEETHEALRERTKSCQSHNQASTRKTLETNARQSRQYHEEYLRQDSGESQEARREVRHPWTGREKGVFSRRAVTSEKEGFCGSGEQGKQDRLKSLKDSVDRPSSVETISNSRASPRVWCVHREWEEGRDDGIRPEDRRHKSPLPFCHSALPLCRPACCHPRVYREGKEGVPESLSCLRAPESSSTDLLFKKYIKQVEKVERQIEREQRLTRRRIEEGDVEQIQQVVTKNTKLVYFLIIVNITVLMLCFFFALFPIHLSNHEKAIRPESSFDALSDETEAVRDFGVSPRPLKSFSSPHVSSASPFFPVTATGAQPYPFLSASPLGSSKRNPRHRGHSAEGYHLARERVDFARRDVGNVQEVQRDGRPRLLVEHRSDVSDTGAHMLRSPAAAGAKKAPPENGTSGEDRRESESRFSETNKQANDRAGEEDRRHRVLLVTPLTELYEIPAETFKDLVIVLKINPSGPGSSHEPAGSTLTKVLSVAGVEEQTERENPSGSRRKTIFFYTGDTLLVDKKSATLKNAKGEVVYYWDFVVDEQPPAFEELHGRREKSANVDGLGILSRARSEFSACEKERRSDKKTCDGNDASQNSIIQSGRDSEAALSPPSVWTGETTPVMDFEVSSNRQEEREASEKTHATLKTVDCTEAQETPLEEVMKKAKSVFSQATDRRGERNQSLRRTRLIGAGEAYERGGRSFASGEKTNDDRGEPGKRADENPGVKDNANRGKEHTLAAHSSEDKAEKCRGAGDGETDRAEENAEGEMKPASQPRITEETLVENDLREARPSSEIETPTKAPPRRLMANAMLGFANAFDQFARIGGALLSPAISMAQTLDVAGALIANPQAAGLGANALPVYAPPSALTVASTGVPSYGTFASTPAGSVVSGIAANTPPPPRLPQAVGSAGLSVSSFGPATVAVQSQPQIVYTASATPQQTYVYSGGLTGPVFPVSTGTVGTVDSSFLTYPGAYYTNGGYQAITVATPAVNDGSLYVIATGQENQETNGNEIRNLSSGFSDAGAWASAGSPDLAPDGSAQSGILSTSLGVPLQRRLNDVRTSAEEIRNEGSGDSVLERNKGR
ncbi:putative transmembrane protein [Toxoplasma gondii p89]|uniref:Putative transmembrane protein n=1 Tax=Toxoplasma gondii p89 TaxID=943119 RepID=A0A086L3W5_TOXGO|nr:putative transmembrane protein [Toxoplasma gondii p89]